MKRFFDWLNAPAYNTPQLSEDEKIDERRKLYRVAKHEKHDGRVTFYIQKLSWGHWRNATRVTGAECGSWREPDAYTSHEYALERIEELVNPQSREPKITIL